MGFSSMPPFGSFPPFGLPTSNFPSMNSFASSTTANFPPPPLPSLLSNDSTNSITSDMWSNGLAAANTNIDYNEYAKQLGLLMNAFNEQSQLKPEVEKSKSSSNVKSSKSKRSTPTTNSSPLSSSDIINDKTSTSKPIDESHHRPTSTSSSTSSRRSSSTNPKKSSNHNSNVTSSSKLPTNNDSSVLDPLAFAAAAASGSLTFPYFLPSLLSQSTGTNNNSSTNYPFSALSSSLINPAAAMYPFLSPDWFTSSASSAKLLESFNTDKSTESNSHQVSKSKQSQKHITSENKHLPSLNSLLNESPSSSSSSSKSKKRAKSIRALTEEQELKNSSLLHSALTEPTYINGSRENLLDSSRRSSINDTSSNRQTPLIQSADESRSNDDDDSDPNPKRRKTEEVNEALVRTPLNRGWKRVTIVRAITRTGVRGDVSYYAPCGRKLRSFQEIDRYLSKKNITDLDRSHFTFSSKVHIGHFHEPKEGPDGKTIFQESTEDEIVNRITEMNPKFRRIRYEYESDTPTKTSTVSSPCHNNGINDHHQAPQDIIQQMYEENRKLRLEQEEMAKRAAEIKTKRETMRLLRNITGESSKTPEHLSNSQYQHNDFLKAIIEQQKLAQQQEHEHKQKLQQEQQEQERKRQELAYLKQLELKKRQDEKNLLIEQRKAEKNAEREKKIQEKYIEIVHAKEAKRIAEDMQLRDLKPLPILKPVENMRLSIEGFANSLMIIQFLNNFKRILQIPDNLIPTLNTFQQSSSLRDINSLCQILLTIAIEDPGISNPKKGLTILGQKLSEIDITEHTFSEILRLYIRERNGFDDKITQNLSDTSFQSLIMDDKLEILAFLCNDLSANKHVVEEVDRNLDELNVLKHEKLEIEKRLRRLKIEKSNNPNSNNNDIKKMTTIIREKDVNSSDNESPNESDGESLKNDDEISITNDPAAITADDQDIETIDETKIDDLDKRLTLVTRKYTLIKRRVIDKQCYIRAIHLGQDRYRRRYWYFSHLSGIYVEGLTSGDISSNDIKDIVQNATKLKLDKTGEVIPLSRSAQRKKQQQQQTKVINPPTPPLSLTLSTNSTEQPIPIELDKIKNENSDNEEEQPQVNLSEDLTTMGLSAFCMAAKRDDNDDDDDDENDEKTISNEKENQSIIIKDEISDEINNNNNKRDLNEIIDDTNLPLDLSCSKPKRTCEEDYWSSQHKQAAYPLPSTSLNKLDQFQELNGLATTAILLNNIKQENLTSNHILNLTHTNPMLSPYDLSTSIKQESSTNNFKQIEQSIREKFQYSQPLPIPDDVQSGWWLIQTSDEIRQLMKSLVKRGQRERYLCRMLQRYFDIITNSIKLHSELNPKPELSQSSAENNAENEANAPVENENINDDNTHEMDVLNEIYDFSDRIISSSLHCRSYDTNNIRNRLTYSDIQSKGSDILDEVKHLLIDIERNIERRYLKHPFVRRYEINLSSLNRINQNSTYHHTIENSTDEIASPSKYDEVPQQLERWRRTVNESRTPAQLALCLTQLERCIAWERSIMKVYCEICNSDSDEEKLLLCDGCDHGTHTYCFLPPMSFIPPNDWYCYVCIGKAKGENLCFVCGNKGDIPLNRCEHCGKLFHENCLKNAKQQRGKWFCVLCSVTEISSNGNTPTKSQVNRQTSRSANSRQPSNTNGDTINQSPPPPPPPPPLPATTTNTNISRNKSTNNRKSKSNNNNTEYLIVQESHSNSSHADATTMSSLNDSSSIETNDIDDDIPSPTIGTTTNNSKKKSSKKSKINNDVKHCRIILNELLKSDVSWPFQTAVDAKQHPEYYECIKNPMDFSIMKKKMRNNQYTKREDFFHDMELILNNCEYFNEDDSPVGQAGHLLRTLFQSQWTKQFG
ncbi:unnamed protein product [Adineta steineri]|uniref:Bromodomain adjacent to zinc finger domain protein 2B-like n=1 Tax=Adineta steineri TaxID=433720 RepID=A0A814C801_9BILA|nr:unnamed protein product [Adineta steineri]